MRDSTSRPRWSVPSRWALPSAASSVGAFRRARSDWRVGSWGAIQGAAAATTISASTNRPPAMTSRRVRRAPAPPRASAAGAAGTSAGPDAGIEEAIDHVDQEVEDDEEHGGEEHHGLHDRVVAAVDRLDRQSPDPRPREDGLGDDGTAEQGAELQPGDGQDGDGRVPEGVLGDDEDLGEALGPRRPHVVLPQDFEHRR